MIDKSLITPLPYPSSELEIIDMAGAFWQQCYGNSKLWQLRCRVNNWRWTPWRLN